VISHKSGRHVMSRFMTNLELVKIPDKSLCPLLWKLHINSMATAEDFSLVCQCYVIDLPDESNRSILSNLQKVQHCSRDCTRNQSKTTIHCHHIQRLSLCCAATCPCPWESSRLAVCDIMPPVSLLGNKVPILPIHSFQLFPLSPHFPLKISLQDSLTTAILPILQISSG
jgi:hypothetical protein